jgi:hypothetical protein
LSLITSKLNDAGSQITNALALGLFKLVVFWLKSREKYYWQCFSACRTACFVEAWTKIEKGKPVDADSRLAQELGDASDYYLVRQFKTSDALNSYEKVIFRTMQVWAASKQEAPDWKKRSYFEFVRRHRLARILRRYISIHGLIAVEASKELEQLEKSEKIEPSVSTWEAQLDRSQLPAKFQKQKVIFLRRYLNRQTATLKRDLARRNYKKIDFELSDLTALAALSGTLLVLLGYFRVAALHSYFGVPYERYFSITDYLASSVGAIHGYLIGTSIAVVSWWFGSAATENSYSLQQHEPKYQTHSERFNMWGYIFLVFMAAVAGVVTFIAEGRI